MQIVENGSLLCPGNAFRPREMKHGSREPVTMDRHRSIAQRPKAQPRDVIVAAFVAQFEGEFGRRLSTEEADRLLTTIAELLRIIKTPLPHEPKTQSPALRDDSGYRSDTAHESSI